METNILELEKKYWEAMENNDFDTVKRLTRFPCIVAGRDGVKSVDALSFQKMFESGAGRQLKVLDIYSDESQTIDNTAIIAYLIRLEYLIDNQVSSYECSCTSTWVNENSNWVCAMHTESDLKKW